MRKSDLTALKCCHELRTPLTSIAGSLGLLAGGAAGGLPARAARLVEIAHQNVERLARLVNELLDIDKLEAGQMTFRSEPVDLRALVLRAVEENRGYGERFAVTISAEVADEPVWVEGDIDRLLQVTANLISNAVKYSPRGQQVSITAYARSGSGVVSVTDCGPGIPDDFRARMFHRFAQADASDSRAREGTGLGLAIVQAIVERHSGSVEVDSGKNAGTTFRVCLPLSRGSAASEGCGS